jgi:hypothetical protein
MQDRQELIETFLANDDQGRVLTVEVWATVSYTDEFGIARRSVGVYAFRLSDGSRLIRHSDDSFVDAATGRLLRRVTI